MSTRVYTKDLLKSICDKDKCVVNIDNFQENIPRSVRISFICNCGNEHIKAFIDMKKSGGYCSTCTNNNRIQNIKNKSPPSVHTRDLLEELSERDKFSVKDIDEIQFSNAEVKIKFICKCGKEGVKKFLAIDVSGGFCKDCTNKQRIQKFTKTSLEHFGTEHPQQSKEIQEKSKQTYISKYGVDHPLKSETVKAKKAETCLQIYNVSHQFLVPEIQEKCKSTILQRYGVYTVMLVPEIAEKQKQTCMSIYGVENPSQHPDVAEKQAKSSHKIKQYEFPCGTIIQVQGYEPKLLDILVQQGYSANDIITKRNEVPKIVYYDDDNKLHRYFCDAYIPKTNTIYEVKSDWTFIRDKYKNILKQKACLEAGYNFEFYIFNNKGKRILIDDLYDSTISLVASSN